MGFLETEKPHAVCFPYPAQGHINPMLKLAKLLHAHNFHITFVLTEYNYDCPVRVQGPESVEGLPDFGFASIPDGLPLSDEDGTQDIPALSQSTTKNSLAPFRRLLADLNARAVAPPVSCIVSDGVMTFTLDAARELGIPEILFWAASACSYLAAIHVHNLVDRHIIPLKATPDMADVSNEFLDTEIAYWVPGLTEGLRLKDFPSFIRTTDASDIMFKFLLRETGRASMVVAIFINTFDLLEAPALAALKSILPPIYTIGPLSILIRQRIPDDSPLASITTSLWKEEETPLKWLQGKELGSVVYVNFGSITVMSNEHLIEFAWGLSNSGYNFLWVIRPDLVRGETVVLPTEFLEETKERRMMASWCAQEELLMHPAIGVFLTRCGWNSTLESFCGGVPLICWPFFARQPTNCKYACSDWGVGIEIDNNVNRVLKILGEKPMIGGQSSLETTGGDRRWPEMTGGDRAEARFQGSGA